MPNRSLFKRSFSNRASPNPAFPRRSLRNLFLFDRSTWMLGALLMLPLAADAQTTWETRLGERIATLDEEAAGELGVFIHRLEDDTTLGHKSDRLWYLSSAVKVPIAIVLLQQVENGELSLDDELTLEASDRIDGAGELLWIDPGASYSLDNLLERMLIDSDNVATDMLIRAIGEETLNERIADMTRRGFFRDGGFEPITTLAEVRYGVYGEIHPKARELDRETLIEVAAANIGPERVEALRRVLDVEADALETEDMTEAYSRYYDREVNSATLESYAGLLTALVRGELLDDAHRQLLYENLKLDTYDAYRLEGGLPREAAFIQKTGTQHRRACHMGVVEPTDPDRAIVITACTEAMDEAAPSEALLKRVGEAIAETMLESDEAA
ncbi:serine hydrolase [Salinicola halophilus]|uniref:serine hydrolase n=1 Tax=Salinicola halophilus TaxID=184065 RepID=UPI001EF992F4|nr:serine hydrolase [Salinicola halophilus]